jgi:hypothetical protein
MEIPQHPMPEQRPMLDRYQGRFVGPVLDHLAGAPSDPIGQVHWIVAQTGKEGKEVGPGYDVDRVELDDAHPIHHSPQVSNIDLSSGTRIGKTLGSQGDSTSLSEGELAHGNGRLGAAGHRAPARQGAAGHRTPPPDKARQGTRPRQDRRCRICH